VLLGLLVEIFVPEGDPLIEGVDETLERRYGKKISARGIYRYLRCALSMSISLRAAGCVGYSRFCLWRSPGLLRLGPCHSFLPWLRIYGHVAYISYTIEQV
jgi:hypothetical protein